MLLAASAGLCAAADGDAKIKIKAIKDLTRQGSASAPQIAGYLQDQSTDVRREAVKALTNVGGLGSLDPLVGACGDNDAETQERAVDGLVNFYLPGYVGKGWLDTVHRAGAAVTSLFYDQNDQVVDADTPVRPEIGQALVRLIGGGASIDSRSNAARAAGILRVAAAVPALSEALKSKEDVLMFEALIALQKIRDISAGPGTIFLVRDLNEKIQIAAIDTVGLLRTTEAVPDLKRVVEHGTKKARPAAIAALGQIGDPATRPMFIEYLKDHDDKIRAAACEGLARTGSPADQPLVRSIFQAEKKQSLRLSAAFALVALGEADTATDGPLRYITANLSSRAWRGTASPFLAELGRRPEIRGLLHQFLHDLGDKEELMGLAGVLASCGGKDSVQPLQELSRNTDPEISREALRALRMINARL